MDYMSLKDEHLWQYLINQDLHIVQEFGIGIVGIGALMWAYDSVTSPYIKEIIALIGLGGSLILWMHIFGAGREFLVFKEELKKNNQAFFKKFDDARSWRKKGMYRFLYYPVTRLMTYFMGLVSWAWLTLILLHRGISLEVVTYLNVAVLIFTLMLALCRRYKDIKAS